MGDGLNWTRVNPLSLVKPLVAGLVVGDEDPAVPQTRKQHVAMLLRVTSFWSMFRYIV